MGRYEDLQGNDKLSKLQRVDKEVADRLRASHPGLPDDFVDFLVEIGAGEVGEGALMLYNGLVAPRDIYGPEATDVLSAVALFADDMQGYSVGYQTDRWRVVEINPNDWTAAPLADTFEDFIRTKVAGL